MSVKRKRRKGPYVVMFYKPWPTLSGVDWRFTSRTFPTIKAALAFAKEKKLEKPKAVEARLMWGTWRRMESR